MKALLLPLLLLVAAPALAQTPAPTTEAASDAVGTTQALDEKNGFRAYKFGMSLSEMPGLQKRGKAGYVNPADVLKIGDAKLLSIQYNLYADKLYTVLLTAFGTDNCDKLEAIFTAQYGKPQLDNGSTKQWIGSVATLTCVRQTSYGSYGSQLAGELFLLTNNALSVQAKADEDAKNRKAAGEL